MHICKCNSMRSHRARWLYAQRLVPIPQATIWSCLCSLDFPEIDENLLQGINGVSMYIDIILISGSTEQEHLNNTDQVLQRLEEAGMKLRREKCEFPLPLVTYLGHVKSADGLHTAKQKWKLSSMYLNHEMLLDYEHSWGCLIIIVSFFLISLQH